jgi:hypothetical protein
MLRPGRGRAAQQKCRGRTFDLAGFQSKSTWHQSGCRCHNHSEVRNGLVSAMTEKLVYIHSKHRKAVVVAIRNDKLRMFTWDDE